MYSYPGAQALASTGSVVAFSLGWWALGAIMAGVVALLVLRQMRLRKRRALLQGK